jgi:hypothetical protein
MWADMLLETFAYDFITLLNRKISLLICFIFDIILTSAIITWRPEIRSPEDAQGPLSNPTNPPPLQLLKKGKVVLYSYFG